MRHEYNAPNQQEQLLIAGLHPHLLEKPVFWFQKRKREILHARLTTPFWHHATIVAEVGLHIKLSEFLRSLHDLGYARVQTVIRPGEYAAEGGEVRVYPINEHVPWRIDFLGNTIETIEQTRPKETQAEISPLQKKFLEQNHLGLLKPGDYVVHADHGIGIFRGLQEKNAKQYISIEYCGCTDCGLTRYNPKNIIRLSSTGKNYICCRANIKILCYLKNPNIICATRKS